MSIFFIVDNVSLDKTKGIYRIITSRIKEDGTYYFISYEKYSDYLSALENHLTRDDCVDFDKKQWRKNKHLFGF